MENNTRLAHLWQQYSGNTASAAELQELKALLNDPDRRQASADYLIELLRRTEPLTEHSEIRLQSLLQAIGQTRHLHIPLRHPPVRRGTWWTAAAAILLLLGAATWLWTEKRSAPPIANQRSRFGGDIAPPSAAMAVLTLASGQKINLDSAGNGTLASQGQVKVVKLVNGQIAYTGHGEEVMYNTITNPRGSRVITLTLADGTKVWLNAESSLHYPTVFSGKARTVEITGEGYFEVAQNANMPFTVRKGNTAIAVLGTSFNINSYDDESTIKVTLVDGAVKVSHNQYGIVLKPGQQARVANDVQVAKDVDLEAVLAWKNGHFQFEGAGIQEVMRQVARWYDVDIQYQGQPKEQHFRGGIPRTADVSKVFTLLENTGAVHFKIDNKKIIVIP
jgi:transmembrane sensor